MSLYTSPSALILEIGAAPACRTVALAQRLRGDQAGLGGALAARQILRPAGSGARWRCTGPRRVRAGSWRPGAGWRLRIAVALRGPLTISVTHRSDTGCDHARGRRSRGRA